MRRRTLENAHGSQETLQSIVKLVDQIENMPVGQDVLGDVHNALTALEEVRCPSP
jgi:GPI-anchor transamidase subunit S